MEKKQEPAFEEKLNRLNEIVERVENSTLPLEESLKLYEEGMALVKDLQTTLDEAEKKIEEHKIPSDK